MVVSKGKGEVVHSDQQWVEELDEWRTQKLRSHDKLKLHHDKLNISPNKLKVGDKVLIDAADPRIATSEPNGEIPFTVLSIFPYGTVEVIHPKFSTFKTLNTGFPEPHGQAHGCALGRAHTTEGNTAMRYSRVKLGQNFSLTRESINFMPHSIFPYAFTRYHVKSTWQENRHPHHEKVERSGVILGSHYRNQTPVPPIPTGTVGGTILNTTSLTLSCWRAFVPALATYDPSRSKASALAPSLRYLHAILAHTLTGRRESTSIANTHDAYFLWSMEHGNIFFLAYFITLAIHHQTERHRKGVISIGPYVTRLARYFGLLNTAAQSSSLTLISQMSPQGILSMLHMRMIEKRCGTYPPQYCLIQSAE
ncbi:hypothetical protein GOBAR_AA30921 [Gossypium barbadense]|uniref:Uncharacterized protein n=1 Tax=Gossypium barbadense TaxID=3634 RepID=A0A2P5WF92_GOSBA|nr:hypothetical protein GOBAR_AA30921 [Gossypium barbadense]